MTWVKNVLHMSMYVSVTRYAGQRVRSEDETSFDQIICFNDDS